MPLNLSLEASTSGPDDAEALARVLEIVAQAIRAGGGSTVSRPAAEHTVATARGEQQVFCGFTASP